MAIVTHVFWAGVSVALVAALYDCTRTRRGFPETWLRARLIVAVGATAALVFLTLGLLRLGPRELPWLLTRTVHLLAVTVVAAVFVCGGWFWIRRAGHIGLFERVRRRMAGWPAPSVARAAWETLAVSAAILGFSIALMLLVQPSSSIVDHFESPENMDTRSGYLLVFILVAPVWEEITFRWYLLNRLEAAMAAHRWGRFLAIVATAALWSCGHAAWTDPAWVKLLQIFAAGCLLAWRFPVIGLSGCILAHLTLNLPAILLRS